MTFFLSVINNESEIETVYDIMKEGLNQKGDKDIPRIIVDCDYEAFVDEIVLVWASLASSVVPDWQVVKI